VLHFLGLVTLNLLLCRPNKLSGGMGGAWHAADFSFPPINGLFILGIDDQIGWLDAVFQ
jgi:hypothetical protein